MSVMDRILHSNVHVGWQVGCHHVGDTSIALKDDQMNQGKGLGFSHKSESTCLMTSTGHGIDFPNRVSSSDPLSDTLVFLLALHLVSLFSASLCLSIAILFLSVFFFPLSLSPSQFLSFSLHLTLVSLCLLSLLLEKK